LSVLNGKSAKEKAASAQRSKLAPNPVKPQVSYMQKASQLRPQSAEVKLKGKPMKTSGIDRKVNNFLPKKVKAESPPKSSV